MLTSLAEVENLPVHREDAVPAFFRAEILGTSVVGERSPPEDVLEGDAGERSLKHRKKPIGKAELNPAEVARIQAKAMKLAFPREAEIVASSLAPPATANFFSFSISTDEAEADQASSAWEKRLQAERQSLTRDELVYHAATLEVWTHAGARSQAIRETLDNSKSKNMAKAIKAASSGRRLGKRLDDHTSRGGALMMPDTDIETEAFFSETDAENRTVQHFKLPDQPLWVPYTMTICSRYPLYDTMLDYIRVNYAKNYADIAKHSVAMVEFLNIPASRPGEILRVPAGMPDVNFVAPFPYLIPDDKCVTLWPVFNCLSADNLLTICEVILSPLGRVIVHSQHPILAAMTVFAVKHILEQKQWHGLVHQCSHTRDIPLLVDDVGPYLLGMHSTCIASAARAGGDVLFVDIDGDSINCSSFRQNVLSNGSVRDHYVKTLEKAIDRPASATSVPREFQEAFPQGRFRPLSKVEASGRTTNAERMLPPTNWNYDQAKILQAFAAVLSTEQTKGLSRFFSKTSPRKLPVEQKRQVQVIIRQHASVFIDKRDLLEARIWRLNRRLALLLGESDQWKSNIDGFKRYATRQDVEARGLRAKLQKEKLEAKRLSGALTTQQQAQEELKSRLEETERAREKATAEIESLSKMREEMQAQHAIIIEELSSMMASPASLHSPSQLLASPPTYRHTRSNSDESMVSESTFNEQQDEQHGSHAALRTLQSRMQDLLDNSSKSIFSQSGEIEGMPTPSPPILSADTNLQRTVTGSSSAASFVSAEERDQDNSTNSDASVTAIHLGLPTALHKSA